MRSHAPRILRIQRQPLDVLREISSQIRRRSTRLHISREHRWRLRQVKRRIARELKEGLVIAGKCAAEHRFVNEVDSDLGRVPAGGVADVVTELIFFLVAQVRKEGDRRSELVVTKSFKAGNRERG